MTAWAAILTLIKATPEIMAAVPQIVGLIIDIKNGVQAEETNIKIAEHIKALRQAWNDKNAKGVSNIINSAGS